MKEFSVQRLRNITTGKLHTKMEDIYEDLGWITGVSGPFTHMLPGLMQACLPFLHTYAKDSRLWNDKFDPDHSGTIKIPKPTPEERRVMREIYERYST